MAHELYYTSAPRGLRAHSSGFCTVGLTRGFPAPFIPRLESLSGYRPPVEDAALDGCPTAHSHWIVDAAGLERHVLSAVRPTVPDHTGRTNKVAHHLLLHASELVSAGPAWLISQRGVMEPSWVGEPRELPAERHLPASKSTSAQPCAYWNEVCGDAGWAGVIANAAMLDPSKPCAVVYPLGCDAMRLIGEALSLLPSEWRWRVTFTSYFMQPIAGLRCTWRFCLDGTEAASAARASGGTVVDLTLRAPCTRTGSLIEQARHGAAVEGSRAPSTEVMPHATPVKVAPAAATSNPKTRTTRMPSAEPAVETGVDYVDDDADPKRSRSPLLVLAVAAAIVFLLTTIVFFTLWQRAVASAPAPNAPSLGSPSQPTSLPASHGAEAPPALEAAEALNAKLRAENGDLTGEVLLAKDTIVRLEEEITSLKTSLDAMEAAAKPPSEAGRAVERQPVAPTRAPSPALTVAPTQTAPDDLGPTRASDWQVCEAAKLGRDTGGNWGGARKWTFTGRTQIYGATWVTGDETPNDAVAPEGSVLEAGQGDDRGAIARLEHTKDSVTFRWVANSKQVEANSLKGDAVLRAIYDIPIRVDSTDQPSAWASLRKIESREISAEPSGITVRLSDEAVHCSHNGQPWITLATSQDTRQPVTLAGGSDSKPVVIGALLFSRKGAEWSVRFELDPDFDPVQCEKRVQEAEATLKQARDAESAANETDRRSARSTAEGASQDLAGQKQQRTDAAQIMKGLSEWRALFTQRGSVPVELSIRAPRAAKSSSRGGAP